MSVKICGNLGTLVSLPHLAHFVFTKAGSLLGVPEEELQIGAVSDDYSRQHRRRRKHHRSRLRLLRTVIRKFLFIAFIVVASLWTGYMVTRCAENIGEPPAQ